MYNDHRLTNCIWWWIVFFSQHHSNFCVCKPSTGLDIVAKEVQVEVLQTYKQFSSWVFYVVFLEKKEMSNDPLPKYSSCQGVGLKPVIVFWSCVVKIKNWAYVFCKHADYMRVCVCVCFIWPTATTVKFSSPCWVDSGWTRVAQCDLPKHTAATPTVNSGQGWRGGREEAESEVL